MKTPIQELIEQLNNVKPQDFCSIETIKGWAEELLEKEKEVIKNAYIEGCGDNILCESTDKKRAEEYYNETFNTKQKMKQSSIEFAVTSLEKLIPSGNQLVIGAILLQAKAMHKEEIENAYWDGGQWVPTSGSQCEEYYNETFNTK